MRSVVKRYRRFVFFWVLAVHVWSSHLFGPMFISVMSLYHCSLNLIPCVNNNNILIRSLSIESLWKIVGRRQREANNVSIIDCTVCWRCQNLALGILVITGSTQDLHTGSRYVVKANKSRVERPFSLREDSGPCSTSGCPSSELKLEPNTSIASCPHWVAANICSSIYSKIGIRTT